MWKYMSGFYTTGHVHEPLLSTGGKERGASESESCSDKRSVGGWACGALRPKRGAVGVVAGREWASTSQAGVERELSSGRSIGQSVWVCGRSGHVRATGSLRVAWPAEMATIRKADTPSVRATAKLSNQARSGNGA